MDADKPCVSLSQQHYARPDWSRLTPTPTPAPRLSRRSRARRRCTRASPSTWRSTQICSTTCSRCGPGTSGNRGEGPRWVSVALWGWGSPASGCVSESSQAGWERRLQSFVCHMRLRCGERNLTICRCRRLALCSFHANYCAITIAAGGGVARGPQPGGGDHAARRAAAAGQGLPAVSAEEQPAGGGGRGVSSADREERDGVWGGCLVAGWMPVQCSPHA